MEYVLIINVAVAKGLKCLITLSQIGVRKV